MDVALSGLEYFDEGRNVDVHENFGQKRMHLAIIARMIFDDFENNFILF